MALNSFGINVFPVQMEASDNGQCEDDQVFVATSGWPWLATTPHPASTQLLYTRVDVNRGSGSSAYLETWHLQSRLSH